MFSVHPTYRSFLFESLAGKVGRAVLSRTEASRSDFSLGLKCQDSLDPLAWKDFDGAEAAFRRAIKIDPNDPDAHSGLGLLLHDHRKDFDGAEAAAPELKIASMVTSSH